MPEETSKGLWMALISFFVLAWGIAVITAGFLAIKQLYDREGTILLVGLFIYLLNMPFKVFVLIKILNEDKE